MLSHISLERDKPRNDGLSWQNDSYMALGGTASGALFYYLNTQKAHGHIPERIILALDKDSAGITAVSDILLKLAKQFPEIHVSSQFPRLKDWSADLTATAKMEFDHRNAYNCILSNNNSTTIKIFADTESMAYKLAEDKHIVKISEGSLPSFFVLEDGNIDVLRDFLNNRFRYGNPVKEINFYRNGYESEAWNNDVAALTGKAEKAGIIVKNSHCKLQELDYSLQSIVNAKGQDLLNLGESTQPQSLNINFGTI